MRSFRRHAIACSIVGLGWWLVSGCACATGTAEVPTQSASVTSLKSPRGASQDGDSVAPDGLGTSASSPPPAIVGRPLDAFAGDTYVGAAARDDEVAGGYDLRVESPPTVGFEDPVATRVRIEARPNWKINLEYPVELELAATGLSPARQTWQLGSATEASEHVCEFLVNWQPVSPGRHAVAGELRFGMCRDSACVPVRERISVQVTIDEPRNEI